MIEAKIIEDSISDERHRLTTLQLTYPRLVHSELMTHRVFSRNASSSRAIPVKKMIEMVRNEPAMPVHWGSNQPGMQAGAELLGDAREQAKALWLRAATNAAVIAEEIMQIGLHKQVANRILEPFQHIHVVLTATEFSNFFALRNHEAADPNIQALAKAMDEAMYGSKPKLLRSGEWHLPYVTAQERLDLDIEIAKKVSAARCARVSYLKHDGASPSVDDDLALYRRLVGSMPIHASPVEHQATPDEAFDHPKDRFGNEWSWKFPELHGNFVGWIQNRKIVERQFDF